MGTPADNTMKRAVELARSGKHGGWPAIKEALLAEGHTQASELMTIEWKRDWIDLLCREGPAVELVIASEPILSSVHHQIVQN